MRPRSERSDGAAPPPPSVEEAKHRLRAQAMALGDDAGVRLARRTAGVGAVVGLVGVAALGFALSALPSLRRRSSAGMARRVAQAITRRLRD